MAKPYAEKRGKSDFPWRVRWPLPPDATGHIHWATASGFATEDDALEHGYEQLISIKNGTWVDPRRTRTPFGEFAAKWLAGHKRAMSTNDNRVYLTNTILVPRWAAVPLGELNWDEIKEWANALAMPRNTVNNSLTLMSTMLTSAVDAKMLGANPLAGRRRNSGVKRPANLDPKIVPWPTPEQAAVIASRMSRADGIMTVLEVFTGLRINELLALHKDRSFVERTDVVGGRRWTRRILLVDRDEGSLEEVEYVHTDDDGVQTTRRRLVAAPPKNRYSVREVDLPPFLADLLDAHLDGWKHPHVFATGTGAFQHYSNYNKRLKASANGWEASPRRRGTAGREAAAPVIAGLSSHGNRHAHATMMADAEMPEVLRRYVLGQKAGGMAGIYEHPTADMRLRRVRLLEDLWWRPEVGKVYMSGAEAVQLERRDVLPNS